MKVSMIGLGKVGSATVFRLLNIKKIDEIMLIDIIPKLLEGEYLDLLHASVGMGSSTKISCSGNIEDVKGSHLVIITAGFPRTNEASRLDLAKKNVAIIRDIMEKIKKVQSDCIILMVANPVDINTYMAIKFSGFKREHIFGMGPTLDFFRFKAVNPNAKMTMGEHGDSMVFVPYDSPKESQDYVKMISKRVIETKGGTWWAPAIAISSIVESIVEDKKDVKVVSTLLKGEYGISDVSLGVPVRLGYDGIEEIVKEKLEAQELESLRKSADTLKDVIKQL